ncbi:hypothetical protein ACH5A7_20790 [Streptomyces sp. NPDC018955]|uniref:hypothetical protein n=1 Tax=Streptomyces sp. NPDC018955 TaxID=3365055 RepID=UPI0037B868DA
MAVTFPLKVELGVNGTWTDFSSRVRYADKIRITRGRRDEGSQTDTARCTFTMDNNDGALTLRNPSSPYYGLIGRNTPVRVSVMTGATYLDLPGNSTADYAITPDDAALDITGDLDVRIDMTLANWVLPPGGSLTRTVEMIGKYLDGAKSWFFGSRDGCLFFRWSEDGTTDLSALSTVAPTIPGPGRMAARVTLDVDNGAGGHTVRFYTAHSVNGPWAQVGDPVTATGTTSIYSSTSPVRIGNATNLAFTMPLGRCHKAEIRSGIDGTVVANPDFTAQAVGATSFVDSAGRTWSTSGQSQITNRKTRFIGEISSWPVRWETKQDVVVNIEASGISRRMSQGVSPVRSPMFREFTNSSRENIVAYWPLEDEASATEFASATDGHPAMRIPAAGGVTPAAYSAWEASAPLPTYTYGVTTVRVPSYTDTGTIAARMFVAVPAAGVTSADTLFRISTSGTARTWTGELSTTGGLTVRAYDADGTQILTTGSIAFALNGVERVLELELVENGADIDWAVSSFTMRETDVSVSTANGTLAGYTCGTATEIRIGQNGLLNGTAVGHLSIADDADAYAYSGFAMVAWNGERTVSRLYRLGLEEGAFCFPASVSEELMGPQGMLTLLDLMREAERADQGILVDSRDLYPAFRFRDHVSLYNQDPAMVLDYTGSDGLVSPLDPTDDDQAVRNDRTVVRSGGSSTRRTLDEGALSTQAPPNGVGRYDDSTTLNLFEDSQTGEHAGWLLHLGTWDETRYPVVRLDLSNATGMVETAEGVDVGDRIDIINLPAWLPPDTVELLVQGYSETLDQFTWVIDYNCTPYGPWRVAVESTLSPLGRIDTDGCELAEDLTADETAVDVWITDGPGWVPAAPTLISNYDFETDLSGWTANGCTITREATPSLAPFLGEWSMKLVPDGVTQYPNAGADMVPVTVGRDYTLSGWQLCETTRSVDLNLNWFDAGGNYLSTSSNGQAVVAGEWSWFTLTATAPPGAAFANGSPTVPDFPPATDVLWSDMVTLRPTYPNEIPEDYPYDVRVGGEVMRVTAATSSVYDTFDRTAASGWGTAESGGAWTASGGSASDYSVTGGYSSHLLATTNASRRSVLDFTHADFDAYVSLTPSATATGGFLSGMLTGRYLDSDNTYMARLAFNSTGNMTLSLRKRVTATETELASVTPGPYTAGTYYRIRFQVSGSTLRAKVWPTTSLEPGIWHLETTDTSITTSVSVGLRSISASANTNVNPEIRYQRFDVVNPQTLTIARSVNGVSKTHSAGASLSLAHPAYTAL